MTIGILYAPGTNCHKETKIALEQIGISSEIIVMNEKGRLSKRLNNFSGLILPGGFSFGDHLGAGRVLAAFIKQKLRDELLEFREQKKQIIGICNGFQVLTESGLLPGALLPNVSGHFESRWVKIKAAQYNFFRTNHLKSKALHLPVAHGEGRFSYNHNRDYKEMIFPAFYYVGASGNPSMSYPENPAGSMHSIAGITDKTGYIMGMMPHPERAALPHHKSQDGLEILKIFI